MEWPQELLPYRSKAELFADRLLEARGQAISEAPEQSADISRDVTRVFRQAEMFGRARTAFPAIAIEGNDYPVPVDIFSLASFFGPARWTPAFWGPFWRNESRALVGGCLPDADLHEVSPQDVTRGVRQPLIRALANRFFGVGSQGAQPTPSASFTLNCRRSGSPCHGMTAFYTPAYFITLGAYGSVLTTPVCGQLKPGYYHFGADAPHGRGAIMDYKKRFDIPVNSAGTVDV